MNRVLPLAAVVLASSGLLAGPAETVALELPESGDSTYVVYPSAAICRDGAVWEVWSQSPTREFIQSAGWAAVQSSPNLGLFCRLVGSDGLELLPPLKVEDPILDIGYPLSPRYFIPVARPDGGLVIVFEQVVFGDHYTSRQPATVVASIDRGGRLSRTTFTSCVRFGREKRGQSVSASLWWWAAAPDTLYYVVGLEDRRVRCGQLSTRGTISQDLPISERYYVADNEKDSIHLATELPESKRVVRHHYLDWTRRWNDYSGVVSAGRDTLLVAYMRPEREREQGPWRTPWPGSMLVVYRLRVKDFSLIDSASITADEVSGSDFNGVRMPRALLQKTEGGYAFFIASREGTSSYLLDAQGIPVVGERVQAEIGTETDFTGDGSRLVSISGPGAGVGGILVEWFGFTETGNLHYESAVQKKARE